MEISGQFHASVALIPGNLPPYPFSNRLSGLQSRSGHCGEEKMLPCRESKHVRSAHAPSLYRLKYPDYLGSNVLRRLFGPKTERVSKDWRILHNGELNILWAFEDIIRIIIWRKVVYSGSGHVACMREKTSAYRMLIGKLKEKTTCEI